MKKTKLAHLSSKVANAFSQLVILLVVPVAFSIDDQGYYFLFASIIAMQYILELGSTQVFAIKISALTKASRHEASDSTQNIFKTDKMMQRQKSLRLIIDLAALLFTIISLLFFVLSTIVAFFLIDPVNIKSGGSLLLTWVIYAFFAALSIKFNSFLMIAESLGFMAKSSKIRALTYLLSCIGFVFFAILTNSLYSVIALPLISCASVLMFLKSNTQLSSIFNRKRSDRKMLLFSWWKKYIYPVQWRMAVSWICGYASFSLVNLFIFKSLGSESLAIYGFSASLFTGISQLAISPVMAILPNLSSLYAESKFNARFSIFKKSLLQAILIYTSSSLLLFITIIMFISRTSILEGRILNINNLLILAFSYLMYLVLSSVGLYLRTMGTEPLLRVSLITASLTSILCYIGANISLDTTVYLFALSMLITLLLTVNVYRQQQHVLSSL